MGVVRGLLEAHATPDQPDGDGRVPLARACAAGQTDCAALLLAADAAPDRLDPVGATALSVGRGGLGRGGMRPAAAAGRGQRERGGQQPRRHPVLEALRAAGAAARCWRACWRPAATRVLGMSRASRPCCWPARLATTRRCGCCSALARGRMCTSAAVWVLARASGSGCPLCTRVVLQGAAAGRVAGGLRLGCPDGAARGGARRPTGLRRRAAAQRALDGPDGAPPLLWTNGAEAVRLLLEAAVAGVNAPNAGPDGRCAGRATAAAAATTARWCWWRVEVGRGASQASVDMLYESRLAACRSCRTGKLRVQGRVRVRRAG